MKKVKIVIIGVGSLSFGRKAIVDVIANPELTGGAEVTLALVDTNTAALETMRAMAERYREHFKVPGLKIEADPDRRRVLTGADYVITAVSRQRWPLWREDFTIPAAFGFQQVLGENGGPGGAFHALRSIHLMLEISRDIEALAPGAWLLNYSNPESRVCLAVSRLTRLKAVGLCHGAFTTVATAARILGRPESELDVEIGGINHFHWMLKVTERATGRDLYPEFHQRLAEGDQGLDALTLQLYRTFGLLPFPTANHTGEYLSFAYETTGPTWMKYARPVPLEAGNEEVNATVFHFGKILRGEDDFNQEWVLKRSQELAAEIICDIEFDRNHKEVSVNLPNQGAIPNLPAEAIVEVPALVGAAGIKPVAVGPLPEAIAALCRTQISIQTLLVDAYEKRSRKLLLQALMLDPVVNSLPRAERLMDEMLRLQAAFLPEFE
ncbi:MAG TPA: alpha-glucosidase/alpha-galactosidase [bacterium]|uniref:Alpha-glucosidase n=1 Tax=candidate division TA06 bacterium ADurb.Bin417 TaxID=1852828 RepID=A0A1V5MLD8_UNCT6|nr:MAG: Alpha-glucosidase [candidate division TA06 bacterium ADurb.Bin417]HNQ34678.1 alpha-glucosidase/alpha-galactosidase [bacterium]HNS48972.1 alpha-glucosidase/alpha-galactosidase [bacterium]